ncbi:hypothetical protein L596_025788 [Steinernema carpocapsae]|uniref:Uncharacterized protein n=1 Tax=Steinernema carpocapsae TaxID=34508 RepID=A0A4U5M8S5_STECR|nr:hypothetical protein L596_025788 [Steinernema carpocapsae]
MWWRVFVDISDKDDVFSAILASQILGSLCDWLCCGTRASRRPRTSASTFDAIDGTPSAPIQTAPQRNGRKISPIETVPAPTTIHSNNQQHVIVRQKYDSRSTTPETSARITRPPTTKCATCMHYRSSVPPQVPKLVFGLPHDFTNAVSRRSSTDENLRSLTEILGWLLMDFLYV